MFTRRALDDKINGFLSELESNNFRVAKAILFGSYAIGKVNENSDIDLAVWLYNFPEKHWTEIPAIPHIVAKYSPISPKFYDVNETGKDDPFIEVIENTGRVIDTVRFTLLNTINSL